MSVTFDVLKLLTSRLVKDEQPLNIPPMCVTFEVLKLLPNVRLVKAWQPENI